MNETAGAVVVFGAASVAGFLARVVPRAGHSDLRIERRIDLSISEW